MNLSVLFFTFVMMLSFSGHSQETTKEVAQEPEVQETQAPASSGKIEKIEVTGSHIKRIDVEGPSPLLVIDNEDLLRSGYNSVSDVLRDTGVNAFGSFREHSGQIGAGTAAVDLRGLGQVRTLILLNGQRLPADASGGAVDLNMIPMGAVDRIEVLKDGASAIYGSDALGGVVNIITKKDFSGHELGGSASFTEQKGGERRDFSYTYGYNSAKLNIINVLFFRHNERIQSKDREWSKFGLSSYGSPGSYKLQGDTAYKPDPKCDPSLLTSGGTRCGYNFGDENWEMPYVMQGSLLSEISYELSSDLNVFARLGYSYKETEWVFAPAFTADLTMASAPAELGADQGKVIDNIRYRFRELGNRRSRTRTNAGSALVGMKGYINDTWDWQTSLSFNKVDRKERRIGGYALKSDIQTAINNNEFNPFAAEGSRGDISHLNYVPQQNSVSENSFFDFKTTGEVGELGAGPIALAVGVQGQRELYRDAADDRTLNDEVLSIASSAGGGDRTAGSAYTEASFQFVEDLETQVAVRYDHYSDFGSTANPKIAFRYMASESLMVRASAGTGFKAPQMQKLYAAQTSGNSTFVDQVHCNTSGGSDATACDPKQYPIIQGGNKNLEEETSFSTNIGTVYQPVRNHSIGMDWWYYDLENLVEDTDYGAITRAEAAGANISDYGATAVRDPNTGELIGAGLYAPYLNISSTETQGIDFNYNGKFPTAWGDFKIRFEHSHMLYFKTEPFPGTGVTDRVGLNGKPKWRNNTTFFYIPTPNHEVSLLARTIGENKKRSSSAGKHPIYTEYDVRYSWAIESVSGKLTVGLKNALGTKPPYDDTSATDYDINFRLYDERGRSLYVGYRQSF